MVLKKNNDSKIVKFAYLHNPKIVKFVFLCIILLFHFFSPIQFYFSKTVDNWKYWIIRKSITTLIALVLTQQTNPSFPEFTSTSDRPAASRILWWNRQMVSWLDLQNGIKAFLKSFRICIALMIFYYVIVKGLSVL